MSMYMLVFTVINTIKDFTCYFSLYSIHTFIDESVMHYEILQASFKIVGWFEKSTHIVGCYD